jgi:hypothetical protein
VQFSSRFVEGPKTQCMHGCMMRCGLIQGMRWEQRQVSHMG